MSVRLLPALLKRIADETIDSVVRNIHQRIDQLQRNPLMGAKFIKGIELPDAVDVPVRHGLGRQASILVSPPYAKTGSVVTGHIRDRTRLEADAFDPSQFIVLQAEDWGTTVYVDVVCY